MISIFSRTTVRDLVCTWNRLTGEADEARFFGRYDQAIGKLQAAAGVAERLGSSCPLLGRSLTGIARCYIAQGNYRKAQSIYTRILPMLELNLYCHSIELAEALADVSALNYGLRNAERAEKYYAQSLQILKRQEPSSATTAALIRMGTVFSKVGRYLQAEEMYVSALAIAEHLGDQTLIWDTGNSLNYVRARQQKISLSEVRFAADERHSYSAPCRLQTAFAS